MKIIKFIKVNNNKYRLILENNEELILYDDVILKYELLITKDIPKSKLKDILKGNRRVDAYFKSLKYITIKMRSKKEIFKYLKDYEEDIVKETIDRLSLEGYLNDDNYIKCYINDQIRLTNKGYYKILKELEQDGFEQEKVKIYLDSITSFVWQDKINEYVRKRKKCYQKYSNKKAKEKMYYELKNLGYFDNLINTTLQNMPEEKEDELLIKEYNKAFKILSKKYQGVKLREKIMVKLINKGFSYEDVKEQVKFD